MPRTNEEDSRAQSVRLLVGGADVGQGRGNRARIACVDGRR